MSSSPNQVASAPRIAVVIVTYNNREEIAPCLESLLVTPEPLDIVVVDNASADGTLSYVQTSYPTVRAVARGHNAGFGAGVNHGIALTTAPYIVVLNPDTIVEEGGLTALIDALHYPGVGLVTPTVVLADQPTQMNARGNTVHLTGLTFCAGLGGPVPTRDADPHSVAAISGAAFGVTRQVWDELNGFDERFFLYLEDTDLSLRVRRLGYDILYVPASRVRHHYRVRVGAHKLYHLERNRHLMLRKNLSPYALALLSPALLLTEVLTWLYALREGPATCRAKLHAYRRSWRERHLVTSAPRKKDWSEREADLALLYVMTTRLSLEQLQGGLAVRLVNGVLTAFYGRCRALVLLAFGSRANPCPASVATPRRP